MCTLGINPLDYSEHSLVSAPFIREPHLPKPTPGKVYLCTKGHDSVAAIVNPDFECPLKCTENKICELLDFLVDNIY